MPRESRPRLRPSCRPNGTSRVTFDVVDRVALDDGGAGRLGLLERARISSSRSPWSTASRIAGSARQQRLALELQVLGQRQDDLLGARAGDLVVPVGDVLLDGDRRERRRVDVVRHPAEDVVGLGGDDRRVPGCRRRRCRPDDDDGAGEQRHPDGAAEETGPSLRRSRAPLTTGGRRRPPIRRSGAQRSSSGRTAHTRTRPPSSATFVPNSSVCGRHEERAGDGDEEAEHDAADPPAGTVFGSVIMKNMKISTSGEMTITRQKSNPHHRARTPSGRSCSGPDAASEPEADGRA